MPKVTINQFHGGLAPRYFDGAPQHKKLGKPGSYAQGKCDPFSTLGLISPSVNQLTAMTNTNLLDSTAVIKNYTSWESGATFYLFAIESEANIQQMTGSTITESSGHWGADITLANNHSAHTVVAGQDIVMYQQNGTTKVFYAWADNTDGDVGIIATNETGQDDDFMTTTPTSTNTTLFANSTYPIILEVADNNFLYMFSKNNIHKYDGTTNGGTNGIVSATVVDIPSDWVILDGRDAKGKMWIAGQKNASGNFTSEGGERPAGVFVWDRVSTVVKFDDFLPAPGATELHSLFFNDGIPHMFTSSIGQSNGDTLVELRRYNGREFEVIKEVGVGNQPARRSVFQMNNLICWQAEDSHVYGYGKAYGELEPALVDFFSFADVDASLTAVGAVGKLAGENYIISNSDGGGQDLRIWQPNTLSQTSKSCTYRSLNYEIPAFSKVTGVRVLWPKLASAGGDIDLAVTLFVNMNSSATKTLNINYSTDGTRGWKYFPVNDSTGALDNVHTVQVGLTWPSTATAVSSSIRPYRIEVDYITTDKKM